MGTCQPSPRLLVARAPTESSRLKLLRNRLPTATELDSDTFQDVMNAAHKPLVVIVAAPPSASVQVAQKVGDIAQRWKDSKTRGDVVFTWMDADKWGSWLKSMYGIKSRADGSLQVIVADHSVRFFFHPCYMTTLTNTVQHLVYYDVDQHGETIQLNSASIFSTINGALAGTISYKHSENMVERFARVSSLVTPCRDAF